MAIDDVYQLQFHYTYAGQRLMNTLVFRMKTAADPTPAQITTLATDWKDQFIIQQSAGVTYTGWLIQQVRGGTVSYTSKPCQRDGGTRYEGLFSGTLVGSGAGDGLPPQAAWVTTLYTGQSGRTKRGRHYLGGLPESSQANGIWNPANVSGYQGQWDTNIAQYKVGGTDANFELGVWSMRTATGCIPNPNPPYGMTFTGVRDPAAAYTGVTVATVRATVYSQRKRTIGVGT